MLRQTHRVDEGILRRCDPLLEEQRPRRSGDHVTDHKAEPGEEQDEKIVGEPLHNEEGQSHYQRRPHERHGSIPREPDTTRQGQQGCGDPPRTLEKPGLQGRQGEILPDEGQEHAKGIRDQHHTAALQAGQQATSHPRSGVRVSPAASEVEASICATLAVVSVPHALGRLRAWPS